LLGLADVEPFEGEGTVDELSIRLRVTSQMLTLAVAVGAAAIALWLDVRFGFAPGGMTHTLAHLGCALLFFVSQPKLLHAAVGGGDAAAPKFAAVFLLFLPSMTYVWLVSIWMLKMLQGQSTVR
jgi:hypothetical protein